MLEEKVGQHIVACGKGLVSLHQLHGVNFSLAKNERDEKARSRQDIPPPRAGGPVAVGVSTVRAAQITVLNLHMNNLASLDGIGACVHLVTLDASANALTDISSELGSLKHLQELNLSANRIARLGHLEGLASLRRLHLARNRLEDLAGLDGLAAAANNHHTRTASSYKAPLQQQHLLIGRRRSLPDPTSHSADSRPPLAFLDVSANRIGRRAFESLQQQFSFPSPIHNPSSSRVANNVVVATTTTGGGPSTATPIAAADVSSRGLNALAEACAAHLKPLQPFPCLVEVRLAAIAVDVPAATHHTARATDGDTENAAGYHHNPLLGLAAATNTSAMAGMASSIHNRSVLLDVLARIVPQLEVVDGEPAGYTPSPVRNRRTPSGSPHQNHNHASSVQEKNGKDETTATSSDALRSRIDEQLRWLEQDDGGAFMTSPPPLAAPTSAVGTAFPANGSRAHAVELPRFPHDHRRARVAPVIVPSASPPAKSDRHHSHNTAASTAEGSTLSERHHELHGLTDKTTSTSDEHSDDYRHSDHHSRGGKQKNRHHHHRDHSHSASDTHHRARSRSRSNSRGSSNRRPHAETSHATAPESLSPAGTPSPQLPPSPPPALTSVCVQATAKTANASSGCEVRCRVQTTQTVDVEDHHYETTDTGRNTTVPPRPADPNRDALVHILRSEVQALREELAEREEHWGKQYNSLRQGHEDTAAQIAAQHRREAAVAAQKHADTVRRLEADLTKAKSALPPLQQQVGRLLAESKAVAQQFSDLAAEGEASLQTALAKQSQTLQFVHAEQLRHQLSALEHDLTERHLAHAEEHLQARREWAQEREALLDEQQELAEALAEDGIRTAEALGRAAITSEHAGFLSRLLHEHAKGVVVGALQQQKTVAAALPPKPSRAVVVQTAVSCSITCGPNDVVDFVLRRHLEEVSLRNGELEQLLLQRTADLQSAQAQIIHLLQSHPPQQQQLSRAHEHRPPSEASIATPSQAALLQARDDEIKRLQEQLTESDARFSRTLNNLKDSLAAKEKLLEDVEDEARDKIDEKRARIQRLEEELVHERRAAAVSADEAEGLQRAKAALAKELAAAQAENTQLIEARDAAKGHHHAALQHAVAEAEQRMTAATEKDRAALVGLIAALRDQLMAVQAHHDRAAAACAEFQDRTVPSLVRRVQELEDELGRRSREDADASQRMKQHEEHLRQALQSLCGNSPATPHHHRNGPRETHDRELKTPVTVFSNQR